MISISRTFTRCLLAAGLAFGVATSASAQSGNYSFPLQIGSQTGYVFSSYTTSTGTCGSGLTTTTTIYTLNGWSISGTPSGAGSVAGTVTYVTAPVAQDCPLSGWYARGSFNLTSPGYFSGCSNPSTGWEGGYITLDPLIPASSAYFTLTVPSGCNP